MPEVPRTATPITLAAAAPILRAALEQKLGRPPSRQLAVYLMAQVWFETGRGRSVIQYNWGNLTTVSASSTYWRPSWFTVTESSSARDKSLHDLMEKGQAPRAFLAFGSHAEGARVYVSRVLGKFHTIAEAADQNDVNAFAESIQKSGYCPDCVPSQKLPTYKALIKDIDQSGLFGDLNTTPVLGSEPPPSGGNPPTALPTPGLPPLTQSASGGHLLSALLILGTVGYIFTRTVFR